MRALSHSRDVILFGPEAKAEPAEAQLLESIKNICSDHMKVSDRSIRIAVSTVCENAISEVLSCAIVQPEGEPMEDFLMASTYKLPIVIYCLYLIEQGNLSSAQLHTMVESDFRREMPGRGPLLEGTVNIEQLLEDIIQYSGNAATDIILRLVGGAKAVTDFLKEKVNIHDINISRTIQQAFSAVKIDDGVSDRGTPRAINFLLAKVFSGQILKNQQSIEKFFVWMQQCVSKNKDMRIHPDILSSPNIRVGCKTGTVPGLLMHNVAVIELEDSARIILTIYMQHCKFNKNQLTVEKLETEDEKILQEISKVIYTSCRYTAAPVCRSPFSRL